MNLDGRKGQIVAEREQTGAGLVGPFVGFVLALG